MNITENVVLADYTTFKIGGKAQFFCEVKTVAELKEALSFAKLHVLSWFVLGEGSNILVSDTGFNGLVIRMMLKGVSSVAQGDSVKMTAGAGENWDQFVAYTVALGLYGLENLSFIPGTVGAAPVQNIGAYGVEARDVIESVSTLDVADNTLKVFSTEECKFAYRESFFKTPAGKNYIITSVTFNLTKNGEVKLDYKDLKQYYLDHSDYPKSLEGVRKAVIAIRTAKLPDWHQLGTAGSFFKNPIISRSDYKSLLKKYPELPAFELPGKGFVKVPLAWILDRICGCKGIRRGNVGVYEKQSLVLVNYGNGTSAEISELAQEMTKKVKDLTGIAIEPEVQYIG